MREEAQLLLISGIDPSAHRKAERLAITPEHTFESVAREWVTSNVNWSVEHKKRVLRYFELYVFPTNGSFDITKMKVKDLLVPHHFLIWKILVIVKFYLTVYCIRGHWIL
ncbi:TPA: hypothetical protein ACKP0H_003228 [Serratia marcescens]